MSAEHLLARLDRVRQVAPGRWVACCPAHDDRNPSLSIRELDDHRVLLHDFAGCDTEAILGAVGLTMADLFPERITHHTNSGRANHWHAMREALRSLHFECLIVAVGAENAARGAPLPDEDRERLIQAAARIRRAVGVVQ